MSRLMWSIDENENWRSDSERNTYSIRGTGEYHNLSKLFDQRCTGNNYLFMASVDECKLYAQNLECGNVIAELEAELTLTKHALANATEKLHGSRKHRHEIISRNPNGSTTTAILLADSEDPEGLHE